MHFILLSFPQDNKKGRHKMNKIKRINQFLNDYRRLNPYLKSLLFECKKEYELELTKEYIQLGYHPYPNEYLDNT